MKKSVFIILALATVVYLAGCGKKQKSLEEMQEPMSMEQLSTLNAENKNVPEVKVQEPQAQPAQASTSAPAAPAAAPAKLTPLPPSGPFKPTAVQIQTALKNAGYYTGNIDRKIGPKSKKAIEEFQKANGLKADGKVGPRTWEAMKKYLNPAAATPQS
jgi:murein L,D-transpeptidase YcbB/YkuD